ncbi:MAG: exopolyphosphatase [Planctomycetota bacterium]
MVYQENELLAAVDLGSNSFHMLISRLVHGELRVVNRLRERVRIAAGLDADRYLTEEAQERALGCLERFGEQLSNLPNDRVRAVGTNTLRRARNRRSFLRRAEKVLGNPIDVISGQEEARLVYVGVASEMPPPPGKRFVVDIGGGSTECILGEAGEVETAESLYMGCVSFTQRYFPGGAIDRRSFREARIAARLKLQGFESKIAGVECQEYLGSSGTAIAIAGILAAAGWSDGEITLDGLKKLRKDMIETGSVDDLDLPGLKSDRKPVLPGGVAILTGVFESLGIERMQPSPGALREGLLMDLLQRSESEDVRERTIRKLARTFQLDQAQCERVAATAQHLLDQTKAGWTLDDTRAEQLLRWAAWLHEVGMAIAHSSYHKHGQYLLENVDMAGFSNDEQVTLATLVRAHRKKIPRDLIEELPHVRPKQGLRLCVLLRLAVLLHRTRGVRPLADVALKASKSSVALTFAEGWLDQHPLTRADLETEAKVLSGAGITLSFE